MRIFQNIGEVTINLENFRGRLNIIAQSKGVCILYRTIRDRHSPPTLNMLQLELQKARIKNVRYSHVNNKYIYIQQKMNMLVFI